MFESHLFPAIKILFPGSAQIRMNPKEELSQKINYLEELGSLISKMNRYGYSVNQMTKSLFPKRQAIELFTLGHFSRKRLVRSFLGLNEY